MFEIVKATMSDLDRILEIYKRARQFMKDSGNPDQWGDVHPPKDSLIENIEEETLYVFKENGVIHGVFFYSLGPDPTYEYIEGKWLNEEDYGVIHRIAVKYHGRGIVDFCFGECFKIIPNIKIDTHENNIPMKKCLQRCGFEHCGIIYLANGESRVAYQKVK